jgi:biotin carboxyl carrier protein
MTTTAITIGSATAQWATTATGWELTLPDGSTIPIDKATIAPFTTEGSAQQGFLTLHGKQWPYTIVYSATDVFVWVAGQTLTLPKPLSTKGRRSSDNTADKTSSSGVITATMPGNIVSVAVTVGQSVNRGDVLVVMESMKMELSLTSAIAGTVAKVNVTEGDKVAIGQVLVEVTPAASEGSTS